MRASEFARLLRAKRAGKNKWVALCPVHHEKTPSLHIKSGATAILITCFGCHASPRDIVAAMGLKMTDLWYSQRSYTPEISQKLKDERRLESLEYDLGIAILARAIEPNKLFWEAKEHAIREERKQLLFKMYPARKAAYDLQVKIRSIGWEAMWDEYWREHPREDRANPIVQPLQANLF